MTQVHAEVDLKHCANFHVTRNYSCYLTSSLHVAPCLPNHSLLLCHVAPCHATTWLLWHV